MIILKKTIKNINKLNIKDKTPSFLLCVSGGMDSMVMLDVFRSIRSNINIDLFVIHVNYHFQSNACKSESLIKKFCKNNRIDYRIKKVKIDNNSNFESKARDIRYRIAQKLLRKQKLDYICTAHHDSDQIETLYMKFIQNAPITSYRGIIEIDKHLWRPFLNIKKTIISNYAIINKLKWIEDPTNKSLKFLRNKIRLKDLPKIKTDNPKLIYDLFEKRKFAINLFRKAGIIKNILIKNSKISKSGSPKYHVIEKNGFYHINEDVKKIIIQSILIQYNFNAQNMSNLHWKTCWQFIVKDKIGNEFQFINGIRFLISRNNFYIYHSRILRSKRQELTDGLVWNNSKFKFINKNNYNLNDKTIFSIKQKDQDTFYVRNWKHGDKILNKKKQSFHKVSEIFKRNKLSKLEKAFYPVIVNQNDQPVLVPCFRHNSCNSNFHDKVFIKWNYKWVN